MRNFKLYSDKIDIDESLEPVAYAGKFIIKSAIDENMSDMVYVLNLTYLIPKDKIDNPDRIIFDEDERMCDFSYAYLNVWTVVKGLNPDDYNFDIDTPETIDDFDGDYVRGNIAILYPKSSPLSADKLLDLAIEFSNQGNMGEVDIWRWITRYNDAVDIIKCHEIGFNYYKLSKLSQVMDIPAGKEGSILQDAKKQYVYKTDAILDDWLDTYTDNPNYLEVVLDDVHKLLGEEKE